MRNGGQSARTIPSRRLGRLASIAPILLGRGVNLWDGLRGFEVGYRVHTETAESGTAHVTFARTPR